MLTTCLALLSAASTATLSERIELALDDPALDGALASVTVMAPSGEVLFEQNSDKRVMPASNQKILSCLYAADSLGTAYAPETQVWVWPDLITIYSPGDPSMTLAKLVEASKQLPNRNLPVKLVQAYSPGVPPGWEFDDLINRYAAPVKAFTVDQGAFALESEKGKVVPLPPQYGINVIFTPSASATQVDYDLASGTVRVKGELGSNRATLDTLALRNPDIVAGKFFGRSVTAGVGVPRSIPTFRITGDILAKQLGDCLSPSDNQYAEHMLLMAASSKGLIKNPADPYPAAQQGLIKFLTQTVGVNAKDIRPDDGSGLSRHNLVTTRAIAQSLRWATQQLWFPAFENGLAAPGKGTLKSRLQGSSFRGKTGTLDMVVGLSGYVLTKNGERRIVSIIINHATESSSKIREIADGIVRIVESDLADGTGVAYSDRHEVRHALLVSN